MCDHRNNRYRAAALRLAAVAETAEREVRGLPGIQRVESFRFPVQGAATAYLATDYARRLTGTTQYVDAGLHIMA